MVKKSRSVELSAEAKREAEAAISVVARQVKFNVAEYPVSMYVERFKSDTGDRYFVPSYQRNLSWSDEQKSQFIESLIIGLPIPFMFFYQTDDGRMEIVDGSQRMRAMRSFLKEGLRLRDLVLVPELNGFSAADLHADRINKLEDITIRTIILDNDTDSSTRAEMFARINRMGTTANEAEIRRGSLPGDVTNLIAKLAEDPRFIEMTPLTAKAVNAREREELVTRFFVYLNRNDTPEGRFPGYRDRPKKFIYDYLKDANLDAKDRPDLIQSMSDEFWKMLEFVKNTFELGFRKNTKANTVPRVRFEALSVGSALALRANPDLKVDSKIISERMREANFDKVVVSDGANVRSKLEGRIDIVVRMLAE
ncbi:DUF262 domain-containing protein [Pseudomonas sp. gcc21]|uniref:DUF262 domain-containing protein n=1 Tax=Pseudomonas sp. gcc21 TaxID=2726989 RepID=UPI0014521D7A|nr:DUF262 domain-containing protein [Pseudomonas sp. gcc21]QJD59986.1 DUF262 domain-containing protein [Pseudomonas sp. gcc21]